MGKSVRNTSEGILGAIKTVTNKPYNNKGEVRSTDPLPNLPRFQKLVDSDPGVTLSNVESSRSVSKPGMNPASRSPSEKQSTPKKEFEAPETNLSSRYQNPIEENNAKIEARKKNIQTLTKKIESRMNNAELRKANPGAVAGTGKINKLNSADLEGQTASSNSSVEPPSLVSGNDALVMLDSIDLAANARSFLLEKIGDQVSENLSNLDLIDICQPDISVVGPVFNALQYSYHQSQIVRLYGNLVSTAMSAKTTRFAHPGFVDLIRNITEDEARVLSWFFKHKVLPVIDIKKVINKTQSEMRLNTLVSTIAQDAGCEYDDLAESYLANLERVGLLEIPRSVCLTDDSLYIRVLSIPAVQERIAALNGSSKDYFGEIVRYYAKLSVFGIRFCHACIR